MESFSFSFNSINERAFLYVFNLRGPFQNYYVTTRSRRIHIFAKANFNFIIKIDKYNLFLIKHTVLYFNKKCIS